LLSLEDISEAAGWRLSGWKAADIEAAESCVAQIVAHGIPIDDSQPEVIEVMASFPRERRDPWSALCAVAVLFAGRRGDKELFFTAGMEVVSAYRQSKKSRPQAPDDLSKLIAARLQEDPSITPRELFAEFSDQATLGSDGTLADYDPESGALVIQPRHDDELLRTVTYIAFLRRFDRIQEKRQQPVDVATPSYASDQSNISSPQES
jgi:hypothetical protein